MDTMASVAAEIDHCEDTLDVLALVVSHSVLQVFEGTSQEQADMLGIYRWAAANKVLGSKSSCLRDTRHVG